MPLLSLVSEQNRNTGWRSRCCLPIRRVTPVQDQQPARQWSVREMANEAPEVRRASSEPAEKNAFEEFDKHLLIVSEAAAALVDRKTCLEARATDGTPPRIREIAGPCPNERWALREPPMGFDLQYIVLTSALLIAIGFGSLAGWSLYGYFSQPDELSGTTAVSALVERIIAVESNGDANAKNSRSSAVGLAQFLDETWLDLVERIGRIWPGGAAQEKH
jgi:hypothetical protein